MKRAREIGTVLAAAATLLGAVAEFHRSRVDAADTYENTALAVGGTAEDVEALRVRLDAIEAQCKANP